MEKTVGARRRDIRIFMNIKFQEQFRNAEVMRALRNATKETIKKAAVMVADRAKQIVPVKSGLLRATIMGKVRKVRNENQFMASVSTNTKGKFIEDWKVYKDLASAKGPKRHGISEADWRNRDVVTYGYGADVEMGRPGGGYKNTPYLRPALAQVTPAIQKLLTSEVKGEAIKQPKRKAT